MSNRVGTRLFRAVAVAVAVTLAVVGISAFASAGGAAAVVAQPPTQQQDTAAASRQRVADSLIASLGDRASLPADSVFKDIRILKGMPAANLIRVMNLGYGRALGANCTHCHTAGNFAEDTREKRIAREMVRMNAAINTEYVRKIPELRTPNAVVNCSTCHRGSVRPGAPTAAPR